MPIVIVLFLLASSLAWGQSFEERSIHTGNIGLNVTNVGTLGRPNIRNSPDGAPSMEYPINSGIEHLFEAGLWIGAQVNGELRVSTSAVDAASGYSTGRAGFEFTALGPVSELSSLPNNEFFSGSAISHQDLVVRTTDSNVFVPGSGIPINSHEFPLGAVVKQSAYAWNYSFADFFVIVDYEITNSSKENWDSVYVGFWSDMVVRNVNVTRDGGAAFFSKGGAGILPDETSFYVFQVSGDDLAYTQSYGAARILGVEWGNEFFHPANRQRFIDLGMEPPRVNYNFWEYNSTTGLTVYPATDNAKYAVLKKSMGNAIPDYENRLKLASNKIQLISIGPIPSISPGQSAHFVMALVCAKQLPDPNATTTTDTETARAQLMKHLDWAKRTYIGEDINENGRLDPGEDLNQDNKLDKYILPEPPLMPSTRIVPGNNEVRIYWADNSLSSIDPISKERDFEGFKLYRSNLGSDLSGTGNELQLIAQWDSLGNAVGFNNGFEEIKLKEPVVIDSQEYHFMYQIKGLLNGWQYRFVLTAFDQGDDNLGLDPLESSFTANAFQVVAGTGLASAIDDTWTVGVYPNPYRGAAAWDGENSKTRKLYFTNLTAHCTINIYTTSGEPVAQIEHQAQDYRGSDIRWFQDFAGDGSTRVFSGGEHAWDLLSSSGQSIAQGMYLFAVKDHSTGRVYKGTFAVIK
ncbi:MAG: hypothetical protein HYZ16_02430 [Bacteroidetes bacterium]|nr:hypothetical protein [Bacteroidota bacterium]